MPRHPIDSWVRSRGVPVQRVIKIQELSQPNDLPVRVFLTPMEAWEAVEKLNLWPNTRWAPGAQKQLHGGYSASIVSQIGVKYFSGPFYLRENGAVC